MITVCHDLLTILVEKHSVEAIHVPRKLRQNRVWYQHKHSGMHTEQVQLRHDSLAGRQGTTTVKVYTNKIANESLSSIDIC